MLAQYLAAVPKATLADAYLLIALGYFGFAYPVPGVVFWLKWTMNNMC
jgi:hypothetical protein